jgi:hypothetical protein
VALLAVFFLAFAVLGIKPRALCMLGKHSPLSYIPSPSSVCSIEDTRALTFGLAKFLVMVMMIRKGKMEVTWHYMSISLSTTVSIP